MLRELRDHLRASGPLTLEQVAGRFDLDPAAAQGALDLLVRRGDAVSEPLNAMCRGCGGVCSGACGGALVTLYRARPPLGV